MQKPKIGKIVLYSVAHGQVVPAIITQVWSDVCVNLRLFHDGTNSCLSWAIPGAEWITSVLRNTTGVEIHNTWTFVPDEEMV